MRHHTTAAALILTATLTLTGCAPQAPTPGKATPSMTSTSPTPDETRAKMLDIFEPTRTLIGGTDWEIDGETYDECPLGDGREGAEYARQEGIRTTLDAKALSKQIAQLWESRGYHGVTVKPFPGSTPGLKITYGMDANRVLLMVVINDSSATIQVSGGCVPGDAADLTNALVE